MFVLNKQVKADVRKQPFECVIKEKNELLLRYFTGILLKLEVFFFHYIFKNLITTIFKEHLLIDASESRKSWTAFWNIGVFGILKHHTNSKNSYFSEYLSPFAACFSLTFKYVVVTKVVLRAAGLFKSMYMTFCYDQVLKGYFYQCWLSLTIPCNLYCR